MRSFSEGELETLVEVNEESVVQILGGPSNSGEYTDVLGLSHDVKCSKTLKQRELARQELLPVDPTPVGSPVKLVANVEFIAVESSYDLESAFPPMRVIMSNFDCTDRTRTSVGGIPIDIGLSEIDAVVGKHALVGQAGPSRFVVESVNVLMRPRDKLTAQQQFPQRSKFYPSQYAKTLLKHFFEMNPPTV